MPIVVLPGARRRKAIPYTPMLLAQMHQRMPNLITATEYTFHPVRQWRFDLAVLPLKLAIEIEGGGFVQGRHTRGLSFEKDCEKYAEATILGWQILRVTPRQVKTGQAADWVQRWVLSRSR